LKYGGKSYFPPSLDINSGKVNVIFGYCDEKPLVEEVDLGELICGNKCRGQRPSLELISNREFFTLRKNEMEKKRS